METKVKCPICQTLALWENNPFRPFCSEQCKQRDLGKWATEDYSMPVEEEFPSIDQAENGHGSGEGNKS